MQHEAAIFSVQDAPVEGKKLEEWVMEEQKRFGVWLLKTKLREIDEAFYREKPDEWISEGLRENTVETLIGAVTYQRRVYRHRVTGERYVSTDEYVGWAPGERVSPQLKMVSAELATQMSYRAVSEILWKLRGIKISHESVHRSVQEAGERRIEEVTREVEELYSRPGESVGRKRCTIFVEVDSMYARVQRRKRGQPRHIEMRLAVIHEGWEAETPAGNRYRLKGKRIVIEASGAERFWDAVSAELAKEYDLGYCKIVINGDGAEWIRKGLEYFPQAVFQLDRFHWLRALRRAVGNSVKALNQIRKLLEKGDWAGAELLVNNLRQEYPERAELLKEFWEYVWSHREDLGDWRQRMTVEVEIARGLGAAESNIDSVLVSRFKRHRRSWSACGANRLGHLVALRHNGRLNEWLKQESRRDKQTDSQKRGLSGKRYRRYTGDDTAAWLRKGLPLLGTNTTPLVMAVRGLSQFRPPWVA